VNNVLVGGIESYRDREGIRGFVEAAFGMDQTIDSFLKASQGPRLVVVKPNWVQESHEFQPDVWEPVITHPTLIEAVLEALAERMEGQGTICLCDAPNTCANFKAILERGQLQARTEIFRKRWPSMRLEVLDLRREIWLRREQVIVERLPNTPDPRGYVAFNLGRASLLYDYAGEGRYFGADYDTQIVNRHHHGEIQEYLLAGTPVACDLFVNLPKMKTHKKTGITCCLKNLVGITGDKDWLPHHTEGVPSKKGDEFPEESLSNTIEARIKKIGMKAALIVPRFGPFLYRKMRNSGIALLGSSETRIRNGNWSGNDTCWRMVLDLNRALLYGTREGGWCADTQPKRYLAIVDGIVGGEGNSPLCPEAVRSQTLVAGTAPAEVDAVVCRLMGFSLERLPLVLHAFDAHPLPIGKGDPLDLIVNDLRISESLHLRDLAPAIKGGFRPHFGWQSLVE